MATPDETLAELRAARAALYEASSARDLLVQQRQRIAAKITDANTKIDQCRTRMSAARGAVMAALQAEAAAPAPAP
jgi:vacuolar-type H+-ATPase subunit D/Vma8